MPVTTSANQALRKDRRRNIINVRRKRVAKQAVDAFKQAPNSEKLSQAISQVDKLVKNKLIHANKAARIKSRLSKMETVKPKVVKVVKAKAAVKAKTKVVKKR